MNNIVHPDGYEYFIGGDGQWYWRYWESGRELARSTDGYRNFADCAACVRTMKHSKDAIEYGASRAQLTRPSISAMGPLAAALLAHRPRPMEQFVSPLQRPTAASIADIFGMK